MLDFYLLKNEASKPSSPRNLEYIMGLDSKAFSSLVLRGLIDSKLDYYSDLRWKRVQIDQIHSALLKSETLDPDVEKLKNIIEKALESECGIIAYCD